MTKKEEEEFEYTSLIGTFGSTKAEQLLPILSKEQDCIGKVGRILDNNRSFIKAVFESNICVKYKKSILKDFRTKVVELVRNKKLDSKLLSVLENVVRADYKPFLT